MTRASSGSLPPQRHVETLLQQTSIGDYRQKFLDVLIMRLNGRIRVFCGDNYFYSSLKTNVQIGAVKQPVVNHFILGRRMLLQRGVVLQAITAQVAILELNPRIISNWLILLARRIFRRPSILWGHAWPRSGRSSKTDRLRNVMRRLAEVIVVYTETQRHELQERMPGQCILAAPNSLYSRAEMGLLPGQDRRRNFLYVGRLVTDKKVDLLVRAFAAALPRLTGGEQLVIVGDGPTKADLIELCRQERISDRVRFTGHVADLDTLRTCYQETLAAVSPGYVGLSITQCLGFGVPMIIADQEPHAPEIEAAIEGLNSLFFESDSVAALSDKLVEVAALRDYWCAKAGEIAERCVEKYSVEVMVDRMIQAINYASR